MTWFATVQAMTEQLTRIGRGVPGVQKTYRKMPSLILAGAITFAALVMLTVALITNPSGGGDRAVLPAIAATTPAVDVRGACAVLIPLMTSSTKIVRDVIDHPDGSTVDWAKLDRVIGDLQAIRPISPTELRGDVQSQIDPLFELQQRHNGTWAGTDTMDLSDYRSSGLRISAWCAQYVS